jgi:hypothetical protein
MGNELTPCFRTHFEKIHGAKTQRDGAQFHSLLPRSLVVSLIIGLCIVCQDIGCAAAQTVPREASNTAIYSQLRVPTSMIELLGNLRQILGHGLLTDRSFYSEQHLNAAFGGSGVRWRPFGKPDQLGGDVLNLDRLVAPIAVNGLKVHGLSISFFLDQINNGHNEARLDILVRSNIPVYFGDIVQIFGTNWSNAPIVARSPHRNFDPVTAPHGNDIILYEFRSGTDHHYVRVEFKGDASLNDINIRSERGT